MSSPQARELIGWKRTFHLKFRFGFSKLPLFPARYRLRTSGHDDFFYRWSHVMPFMDPARGAFDFGLYGWDVRELRFLRRFLQAGMTFVDIGANHGLYSVQAAAAVGKSGRVIAFEPGPSAFRRLRWHLALNSAQHVEAHRCAVGATAGRETLYIPARGLDVTSSLRFGRLAAGIKVKSVPVEVVRLDDFATAHRLAAIHLIKLDVEGAESLVLEGSAQVVRAQQPIWLFEAVDETAQAFGGTARDLVNHFTAHGCRLFEFTSEGWLQPHQPRDLYPLDSNCNLLAVPPARHDLVSHLVTRSDRS
jgi:FkbM family methyltransferase